MGYRVAYTFDISQTSGKALPTVMTELQGKVHNYAGFRKAIQEVCPVEIIIGPVEGSAKGYYSPTEQEVRIREGMSELQNIKTALHETAHARLHNPMLSDHPFSREEKEIQVESISFIVAAHYGLDTSDYSFPYVSVWASGDMKRIEENLEIIKKESAKIISEIDESLEKTEWNKCKSGFINMMKAILNCNGRRMTDGIMKDTEKICSQRFPDPLIKRDFGWIRQRPRLSSFSAIPVQSI